MGVSGDVVNLGVPETYYITYDCDDTAGNSAVTNYRTVVVADLTCPYCAMVGGVDSMPDTIQASFPYSPASVSCTDTMEGVLTVNPTCADNCLSLEPDVERPGSYTLSWSATDSAGNG